MKLGIRNIYFTLLACIFYANAFAQNIKAEISSNKVEVGERFSITYSIENKSVDDFRLAKLPSGFSIVGGPNTGTFRYIVNNKSMDVNTIGYDLVCSKTGKFIIGAGTLTSRGKNYPTQSLNVEVTKATKKKQPVQQDIFNIFGMEPMEYVEPIPIEKNDIILSLSSSNKKIYIGEPFSIDLRLYTRFMPISRSEFEMPAFKDGWHQKVELESDTIIKPTYLNGKGYLTTVLRRELYIPQRADKYHLDAVKLGIVIRFAQRNGKLWEDYFKGGMVRDEQHVRMSNSYSFEVLDYPQEGKPADFMGATGNFSMAVDTDVDSVMAGEAFTVKVTISGSGNLNLLRAPQLILPKDFEQYEPKISDKISAQTDLLTGSRTFEYIVIPHVEGKFSLEPVHFSYFNPETEKYNSLISDSIPILVLKGNVVVAKDSVDIHPLKEITEAEDSLEGFFPSVIFFILFGILFFGTIALWIFRTKIWDLRSDTDRKRISNANTTAIKRLKKANEFLNNGNSRAFYEECHKAMLGYLQNKKDLPLSESAPQKVKQFLAQHNTDENLAEEAKEILDACEFNRFAPLGNAAELENFQQRCIRFISTMEDKK